MKLRLMGLIKKVRKKNKGQLDELTLIVRIKRSITCELLIFE